MPNNQPEDWEKKFEEDFKWLSHYLSDSPIGEIKSFIRQVAKEQYERGREEEKRLHETQ